MWHVEMAASCGLVLTGFRHHSFCGRTCVRGVLPPWRKSGRSLECKKKCPDASIGLGLLSISCELVF